MDTPSGIGTTWTCSWPNSSYRISNITWERWIADGISCSSRSIVKIVISLCAVWKSCSGVSTWCSWSSICCTPRGKWFLCGKLILLLISLLIRLSCNYTICIYRRARCTIAIISQTGYCSCSFCISIWGSSRPSCPRITITGSIGSIAIAATAFSAASISLLRHNNTLQQIFKVSRFWWFLWCYFSSDTLYSYAGLRFSKINRGRLFQLICGAKNVFDLDKKSYINF